MGMDHMHYNTKFQTIINKVTVWNFMATFHSSTSEKILLGSFSKLSAVLYLVSNIALTRKYCMVVAGHR